MVVSQNGWAANADRRVIGVAPFVVEGVDFPGGVRAGDVATVLRYVVERFHREVEPLRAGWCWGFNYRPVTGGGALSNHASGTAVDINAPDHGYGAVGTFTRAQVVAIRSILAACGGVVRWGGDYAGTKDEMHFEINSNGTAVANLAVAIRNTSSKGDGMIDSADVNRILMGPVTGTETVDGKTTSQTHPFAVWLTVMAFRVRDINNKLDAISAKLDRINERLDAAGADQ